MYDGYTHGTKERDPALEALIPEAHALDSDRRVHKYHMNSFRDTVLADAVKDLGCDSVLLAGAFTQYCVMASYFGAIDHGLSPFLLQGGTIPTRESAVAAAETVCRTYTMEEVRENLRTAKVEPRGNADDWADRASGTLGIRRCDRGVGPPGFEPESTAPKAVSIPS